MCRSQSGRGTPFQLGGEFLSHGSQQEARVRVVDPKFPGLQGSTETFSFKEEWYGGPDVWMSERFRQMLAGAVAWTTGREDTEVDANMPNVTPEAWAMPPEN
jgi:hypothetical protein